MDHLLDVFKSRNRWFSQVSRNYSSVRFCPLGNPSNMATEKFVKVKTVNFPDWIGLKSDLLSFVVQNSSTRCHSKAKVKLVFKGKMTSWPEPSGFHSSHSNYHFDASLRNQWIQIPFWLENYFDSIFKQRIMSSLFNDLQNRGWKKLLLCFGYISFAILSLGMPSIEHKGNHNSRIITRITDFWILQRYLNWGWPEANYIFHL